MGYSFLVVLIAAAIGIPVGLYVGHTGRLHWLVSVTNAARAIPTLGLLFALALWVGPLIRGSAAFVVPSGLALVLLPIPPLVAGTLAGGAIVPLVITVVATEAAVTYWVAGGSILGLMLLGGLAAQTGGAPLTKGIVRVTFWGALAMAATAGAGLLFGATG